MDVFLRKETEGFIHKTVLKESADQALRSLSVFLFAHAGKDLARYLANTRIELPDEVEYLLNAGAARDFVRKAEFVTLVRLYDGNKQRVECRAVAEVLTKGLLFDQSD